MGERGVVVALCLVIVAATFLGLPAAQAQDYPARTVRILVGSAPGSTTDLVGRVVAEGRRARLGQPFIVENKAGANGMLAAETVARAAPDGTPSAPSARATTPWRSAASWTPGSRTCGASSTCRL